MTAEDRTVRLDDLLREGEQEPMPPRHRRPGTPLVREAVTLCVYAAGFAVVAYFLLALGELRVAYPLLFIIALGMLVIRRALREVREVDEALPGDLIRRRPPPAYASGEAGYLGSDGLSRAVLRWETRLEWTATERQRFAARMPALIGELTDERLRQRHGITRSSNRERARTICGPELWAFIEEPIKRIPSPRELTEVVKQLEDV